MAGMVNPLKPRWTGKPPHDINIKGNLFPVSPGPFKVPLVVQIDGSEDYFLPIFSTEEKLHAHMAHLKRKMGEEMEYKIQQVDEPEAFCESVWGSGVRIMQDPIVITDNHTRWTEIMPDEKLAEHKADTN